MLRSLTVLCLLFSPSLIAADSTSTVDVTATVTQPDPKTYCVSGVCLSINNAPSTGTSAPVGSSATNPGTVVVQTPPTCDVCQPDAFVFYLQPSCCPDGSVCDIGSFLQSGGGVFDLSSLCGESISGSAAITFDACNCQFYCNDTLGHGGNPTMPPTLPPTEVPTSPPTSPPTQPATQAPTQPATEAPTTQTPTEAPTTQAPTTTEAPTTQAPTYNATEAPTEAPTTQAPTYPPTETPTYNATEAPTEAPTYNATEAPTEAPTYNATQAPTYLPTTKAPTTIKPTTKVPTTSAPTVPRGNNPTQTPTAAPCHRCNSTHIFFVVFPVCCTNQIISTCSNNQIAAAAKQLPDHCDQDSITWDGCSCTFYCNTTSSVVPVNVNGGNQPGNGNAPLLPVPQSEVQTTQIDFHFNITKQGNNTHCIAGTSICVTVSGASQQASVYVFPLIASLIMGLSALL